MKRLNKAACVAVAALIVGVAEVVVGTGASAQGIEEGWGQPEKAVSAPAAREESSGEGAASVVRAEQGIIATISADPVDYVGPCPAKITFVGTISAQAPCEVHYRFVRSDGESTPLKMMNFVRAASREVITSWQVEKDCSGWQAIEVLEPLETESNRAYFTVKCAAAAEEEAGEVKEESAPHAPATAGAENADDDDDSRAITGEESRGQQMAQAPNEAARKVERLEERMRGLEARVSKLEDAARAEREVAAAPESVIGKEPATAAPPRPERVTKLVLRGEPEPEKKESAAEEEQRVDAAIEAAPEIPEEKSLPMYQYYKISGTPPGANIYEGTVNYGDAPITLRLSYEEHAFTFRKSGYKDQTKEVGVSSSGWIEVTYTLQAEEKADLPAPQPEL